MNLFYLIGYPGVGKTTLTRALFAGQKPTVFDFPKGFRFTQYSPSGAFELGYKRVSFGGTDTLSYNAQPKVLQWLSERANRDLLVYGEGDRLANRSFFDAMDQWGIKLTIAVLHAPLDVAAARRAERGSNQNPSWVQGRVSKVNNLVKAGYVTPGWELDGTQPTHELVKIMLNSPIFESLREG